MFIVNVVLVEKLLAQNELIVVVNKIPVYNDIKTYSEIKSYGKVKKKNYSILNQGVISVFEKNILVAENDFFLEKFAIKFSIDSNKVYKIVVKGVNCYPYSSFFIDTRHYNLSGVQKVCYGFDGDNKDDYIGNTWRLDPTIQFSNQEEINKFKQVIDDKKNDDIALVFFPNKDNDYKPTFVPNNETWQFNIDEETGEYKTKSNDKSLKEIKQEWISNKIELSKKVDSIIEIKEDSTKRKLTDNNLSELNISKTPNEENTSRLQSFMKVKTSNQVYREVTNVEFDMNLIDNLDSIDIEKKKILIIKEKEKLVERWKNAETHEDSLLLYETEQQISNAEKSLELMQNSLKKANEAALANKRLLEQELINSKSIKSRNNVMFWGILISLLLLLATIYFLILSRKLNKKVKNVLNQVEETNEELNQSNEELATQRDEIENQKEIVEESHREITASIKYAKRIQNAILPATSLIKEVLPESFVLYSPKDVVAGDFYWLEQLGNKTLFAAADCTGHGVPGAMVSVVCHNAMNRAVREFGLTEPGLILDKTREIVVKEFEKSEDDVKDGMDIALCSISGNKLQYAGAHNPLWIVRPLRHSEGGTTEESQAYELIEVKANKQPIGKFDDPVPYTTHSIEIQKGDSIYIFSDGYADQFGGERDKKFGSKRLKELLISIQQKSMNEQNDILNSTFENWIKQGGGEQIDDVCIIGVKV